MSKRSASIAQYREWQLALRDFGDTPYTADLFHQLAPQLEICPWIEVEEFEAALERLHRAAWPVAARRPPRMTGEIADILE
jgi:hypothetical protein